MDKNLQSVTTSPKFKLAEVLECKILAGKFHSFILQAENPLSYKPGQYLTIKVAETRINCYSIATDEGGDKFGLLVDTSPGGPGSKYFENLKIGDRVSFLGPFGAFVYKQDSTAGHTLFLATGSGCAPLRRMIDFQLKEGGVRTPIALYLGLRYQTDIFWQDYFEKLAQDYPNFKFILAISKPDSSWQGRSGRITDFIGQDIPDASGMTAYICGNISMIREATDLLISRGLAKEKIYSEYY